ncbi:MAG: hypothetical protein QXZ41_08420 [Ignisphaera sp.]
MISFIVTDKAAYVVEVKTKAVVEDVSELLAKADILQQKLGKPVVPILTEILIDKEVESYAKGREVKVYRY